MNEETNRERSLLSIHREEQMEARIDKARALVRDRLSVLRRQEQIGRRLRLTVFFAVVLVMFAALMLFAVMWKP